MELISHVSPHLFVARSTLPRVARHSHGACARQLGERIRRSADAQHMEVRADLLLHGLTPNESKWTINLGQRTTTAVDICISERTPFLGDKGMPRHKAMQDDAHGIVSNSHMLEMSTGSVASQTRNSPGASCLGSQDPQTGWSQAHGSSFEAGAPHPGVHM